MILKRRMTPIAIALFALFLAGCGVKLGSGDSLDTFTMISTVEELQAIADDPSGNYALENDIDATATADWSGGEGFEPIGPEFTGIFDGQGYVIDGLVINRPNEDRVGLFAKNAGRIARVGLKNADITGSATVGVLVGENSGEVVDAYSTGQVVSTDRQLGGLVGRNTGAIEDSYNAADVIGNERWVGGLVGYNRGTIERSYNTGDVVSGNDGWTGGLVGTNIGLVQDAYSTGDVTSDGIRVGGLIGNNELASGQIIRTYSTGRVTSNHASPVVGGLVGRNLDGATVTSSFWNVETSGQSDSEGGVALSIADMREQHIWETTDWDIDFNDERGGVWYLRTGQSAPLLYADSDR